LDRTKALPTERLQVPSQSEYRPGVAPIPPARPSSHRPGHVAYAGRPPRLTLRARLRNVRTGGGWSVVGLLVLLVGWSSWAYTVGLARLSQSAVVLGLIVGVAIGLFAVLRLAGGLILERMMGRSRRSATFSHLVIGALFVAAGISRAPRCPGCLWR
jgi:hypothetical protein